MEKMTWGDIARGLVMLFGILAILLAGTAVLVFITPRNQSDRATGIDCVLEKCLGK